MPAKNAPFELPPELQAEYEQTAKKLGKSKAETLRLALAKGLPIVREFLLSEEAKKPGTTLEDVENAVIAKASGILGDHSLNAASITSEGEEHL